MTRGQGDESRIGVFVCECGDKIAGWLDLPALTRQVEELPNVTWAGHASHWCLPNGLERMRAIVADQHLDRVVIAGCAPRTHEGHFRQGLNGRVNPTLVNVTNLRDLCIRPHQHDPAAAMTKARDQVAMAVAELAARQAEAPRAAHITPHAIIIGGGIAGMTAALAISDAGVPATLVEREPELGGLAHQWPDDRDAADWVVGRIASVRARSNITVLTNTQVTEASGSVGCYRIGLSSGQVVEAGAIIVATGARPASIHSTLEARHSTLHYAFVLCDMTPEKAQACSHSCCPSALRRAAEIKRQSPDSQVSIFFRELYTAGGMYDERVWEAQRLGVNFVRYPAGQMPQPIDDEIVTHDELTGRDVRVSCDLLIPATPMTPQEDAMHLADMLRLPVDAAGFLADTRVRLRPADRIERGIYVCGAAHYPCDAQRAMFEAYSAAARAVHHIQRRQITNSATAAVIDATRCNGCGDCVRVCPFMAVQLQISNFKHLHCAQAQVSQISKQEDNANRLAVVDPLICTGCGNCVSVCPVKAAQVPSATDEQIEAQIRVALSANGQGDKETRRPGDGHLVTLSPRHLVLACEWSGYSAAEIAGAQGLAYPASTRIIRLNCTGRLQPGLILKALEMGAASVLILGCAPGLCHYEQGNERCAAAFEQADGLARLLALDDRLKLEWVPPDDGERFAQVVNKFVAGIGAKGT